MSARYSSIVGRVVSISVSDIESESESEGVGGVAEGSGRVVKHSFSDHLVQHILDQNIFFWPSCERILLTRRITFRSLAGR
jgi:hypothetical protein